MKISEMSEQSGLSVDTLRYYEKIGLLPAVNRTDGGIRDYDELDVRRYENVVLKDEQEINVKSIP